MGGTCTNDSPSVGISPGAIDLTVSFRNARAIQAYLRSFQSCDDRTLKLRLAELRGESWPIASWNCMGVAARIALIDHPSYPDVIMAIQEKGGF